MYAARLRATTSWTMTLRPSKTFLHSGRKLVSFAISIKALRSASARSPDVADEASVEHRSLLHTTLDAADQLVRVWLERDDACFATKPADRCFDLAMVAALVQELALGLLDRALDHLPSLKEFGGVHVFASCCDVNQRSPTTGTCLAGHA